MGQAYSTIAGEEEFLQVFSKNDSIKEYMIR
jgi:hypothetical protein